MDRGEKVRSLRGDGSSHYRARKRNETQEPGWFLGLRLILAELKETCAVSTALFVVVPFILAAGSEQRARRIISALQHRPDVNREDFCIQKERREVRASEIAALRSAVRTAERSAWIEEMMEEGSVIPPTGRNDARPFLRKPMTTSARIPFHLAQSILIGTSKFNDEEVGGLCQELGFALPRRKTRVCDCYLFIRRFQSPKLREPRVFSSLSSFGWARGRKRAADRSDDKSFGNQSSGEF